MELHINKKRPFSCQSAGLFFCPSWLHDYKDIEKTLEEVGRSGSIGTLVAHPWHMRHTVEDRLLHDAVKFAAETAHRYAMKFTLEMDWGHWAAKYVEINTDMAMWLIIPGESPCINGEFDFLIPNESFGGQCRALEDIPALYGFDASGKAHLLPKDKVDIRIETVSATYPLPGMEDQVFYNSHRTPGKFTYHRISGTVDDPAIVRIRIYVALESYKYPDVAHPDYLSKQIELLETYRDVPLDGVSWDEPGKGSSFRGYKAGRGFLKFFEKRNGYDLRKRMLELDQGTDAVALQTRRDYYSTLTDMNYRAQYEFNQKARELFGADIILGNHHTFSGMAIDLKCGCSDYFKLGENLSDAFTDTGWDVPVRNEPIYNYALAEGLRKELRKPLSKVVDWSRTPHKAWYDYYTRLKMLYRNEWFSIFIGRWGEGHPTFPWDRHWQDIVRNAGQLEDFGRFTGRKVNGLSEMAVWHSWSAVALLESSHYHYVRLWMTGNYNFAQQAMVNSRFFDYVSGRAIESAHVEKGRISFGEYSYRRLALPFAVVLTQALWNKIRECIAEKVELVFFGPPPRWIIETGEDISAEFSRLCGVKYFNYEQYNTWLTAHKPATPVSSWEPEAFDFCLPLVPQGNTRPLLNDDGVMVGVCNPSNGITYLTTPDPREQFFRHIERPNDVYPDISHHGLGAYRLFPEPDASGSFVLVCISPLNERLNEHFSCAGKSFILQGGTWAVLRIKQGLIKEHLLETGTDIKLGGLEPQLKIIEYPIANPTSLRSYERAGTEYPMSKLISPISPFFE